MHKITRHAGAPSSADGHDARINHFRCGSGGPGADFWAAGTRPGPEIDKDSILKNQLFHKKPPFSKVEARNPKIKVAAIF